MAEEPGLQDLCRLESVKGFAEWEATESVRRTINTKMAATEDLTKLQPGMRVAG